MTCNRGNNATQKTTVGDTDATSRTAAHGGASPVNGQHHVNGTSFASEADSSPATNGADPGGSFAGSTSNASTQTGGPNESAFAAPTATTGGRSGIAARAGPLFGQTGLLSPVGSTAGTTETSSPGSGHAEPRSEEEEEDENQENIPPPGDPGPAIQASLHRATRGGSSPGGPRDPPCTGGDDSGAETDH